VKFACERCGKKYATAETPAPGRVYKIKCKACGHLIVVKASAGVPPTSSTEMRSPTSAMRAADPVPTPVPRHPAATADLNLEIGAPEPADPAPSRDVPQRLNADSTQEISMSGVSVTPTAEELKPPADLGYVDLFADPPKEEQPPQDDPFLAAARASLPSGYGTGSATPDLFGPLQEELSSPPAEASQPPSAAGQAPTTTPKLPVIPKPSQQKSALPFILIGAGSLVLVGILAFVLLGGKTGVPPAPVPAQTQARASVPAPQAPPPAALPAPTPATSQPVPTPPAPALAAPVKEPEKIDRRADKRASDDDRRVREDRRQREREAKESRDREAREAKAARERDAREAKERDKAAREAKARADREAKERDRLAREQRARDEREGRDRDRQRRDAEKVAAANLPEGDSGLGQDEIQRVLSSTRKAFEGCILAAGKSGEVKLGGQRVMLRLNIQTNGAVTYPTLDDVTLNSTELGSCLKSAARLMVFPKFKGDTMHVEVPLVLAGR